MGMLDWLLPSRDQAAKYKQDLSQITPDAPALGDSPFAFGPLGSLKEATLAALVSQQRGRTDGVQLGMLMPRSEAKAPWEMTKAEYRKSNPHGWSEGFSHDSRAKGFERLPEDADVWVFHATDEKNADRFLRDGIDTGRKPASDSRALYKQTGEQHFGPQNGLGDGLYVGADPVSIEQYGKRILGIRVKKSDISVPPEQGWSGKGSPAQAISKSDAMVTGKITPDQIVDVTGPNRYVDGHKAFVLKALREGKSVPLNVLTDYSEMR